MRGFTLLELLTSLAIFSLIAALTYMVVVPSGQRLRSLQEWHDNVDSLVRMEYRLRLDINSILITHDRRIGSFILWHEKRKGRRYSHMRLLCGFMAPAPRLVEYVVGQHEMLTRTSREIWRIDERKGSSWKISSVEVFDIQAMDENGVWYGKWDSRIRRKLPKAIKVRWKAASISDELTLPLSVGT